MTRQGKARRQDKMRETRQVTQQEQKIEANVGQGGEIRQKILDKATKPGMRRISSPPSIGL